MQAVQNGAVHYLVKGDDNDKLVPTVSKALEKALVQRHVETRRDDPFEAVTGRTPAIQQAVALARKVAPTEATVLVTGATGTGKEVFAQAIHAASSRGSRSMLAVNCGAFSNELLDSELFGHVAGAFTGATKDKKGFDRSGEGRHALPGRSGRAEYSHAGQVVARAGDRRFPARG